MGQYKRVLTLLKENMCKQNVYFGVIAQCVWVLRQQSHLGWNSCPCFSCAGFWPTSAWTMEVLFLPLLKETFSIWFVGTSLKYLNLFVGAEFGSRLFKIQRRLRRHPLCPVRQLPAFFRDTDVQTRACSKNCGKVTWSESVWKSHATWRKPENSLRTMKRQCVFTKGSSFYF